MPKPQRRHGRAVRMLVPHVVAALIAASVMVGVGAQRSADDGWCDLYPHWPGCPV